MTTQTGRLESLLERINGGLAAEVLPELELLHTQQPGNLAVTSLRAEALRLAGHRSKAIDAYREAGESGAGARNWLAAGILLAGERATEQSMQCLRRALAEAPDDAEILDALITTLFNGGRHKDGLDYARRQLAISRDPTLLSRAALLMQANDLYEESAAAFKRIVELAPEDPTIIGAALVPTRFTCEWEWIESLQQRISACYEQGDFAAPQEFPLTHLTWCTDEARNLGVTRAYAARMVARAQPIAPAPLPAAGRRIRVGYQSSDFRNHATMHLMAGVFEHHDRERFEVFAYDYSSPDVSEYRQRFLDAVEHLVPVHSMSDQQTAQRIAADRLDILFDLKLYTGGGRSGIMAFRPAALQAAYLGFPGSAASPDIDYVVSDRFVTPDSSAPYFTEKFCRLPHSYQCNDRKRAVAADPGARGQYGLPDDKVIFGAFNQSYKIDRGSFEVWMRILHEVPDSVLWLLGQSEAARANLLRHGQLSGIDPARIIYAPFAAPQEHLARLQLADAVLDALVCNGHTTTSDALWVGVPVVTARGRHFASRVSESLLNAMALPELVGSDADDMVRIARRIGTDEEYRKALRAKVWANRLVSPLFDTARFTRDFEAAIRMMVERHRSGQAHDHIDIPDHGPVNADRPAPASAGQVAALQATYAGCPLCNASSTSLGFANSTGHARWHEPLRAAIEWMRCGACGHTHTRHHWTKAGRAEILAGGSAAQQDCSATPAEQRALHWGPVVERAARALGGFRNLLSRASRPVWVDVGCGDGTLIMAAGDHGFAFVGIDIDVAATTRLQAQGFSAIQQDFMELPIAIVPDVLSMMDVLATMPDAAGAIRKAAKVLPAGGLLILSTADLSSSAWRALEMAKTNPYWADLSLHHGFTRDRLFALLRENGFEIADFAVPGRSPAQMEIYAVRKELTAIENLRTADAICMTRLGGLGDVLMAMGAAKALKTLSGRPIIMETAAAFAALVRSCPHLDHVVANLAEVTDRYPDIRHANLNPVSFGISPKHQIDAYLEAFGVSADAQLKNIELAPDQSAAAEVETRLASWPTKPHERLRILLHAGQGDVNRSWPMQNWEELASALISLGHQVIVIGSNADPRRPALIPTVGGILSTVDTLGAVATVALMRRSDILVSADSGPIQLAGATDIGIVGLYSAVSGSCRLPFRHGVAGWRAAAVGASCSFHPCYQQMHDATVMAPFMEKLQNQSLSANELFANWCPDGGSFACMKQQITPAMVIAALGRLEPRILQHVEVPVADLRL